MKKKLKKEKRTFKFIYTMQTIIVADCSEKAFEKFNTLQFSTTTKQFLEVVSCVEDK